MQYTDQREVPQNQNNSQIDFSETSDLSIQDPSNQQIEKKRKRSQSKKSNQNINNSQVPILPPIDAETKISRMNPDDYTDTVDNGPSNGQLTINSAKQEPKIRKSPMKENLNRSAFNPEQLKNDKWQDFEFSDDEEEDKVNILKFENNKLKRKQTMLQSVSSFGKNIVTGMKNKSESQDDDLQFAGDPCYKERYLKKYSLQFAIPTLNVLTSAWYPSNSQYFVQIVSYIVPKNEEFDVQTHFIENKPKDVSKFEDIFAEKIKGCAIRLIKTCSMLDSIKVIDQYVFDLKPRVDSLNISFSIDGQYFVIYSKVSNFIKVFKFLFIEKILDEIRNDNSLAELTEKDDIVEAFFGNNSKYLIVRYKQKLEIYNIKQMFQFKRNYVPDCFELPQDQLESICDCYFRSNAKDDYYKCYLACKVQGQKKIKIFSIKDMNKSSIWETESNSINFFEEVSENLMVKIKVMDKEIKTVFVNGNEQFTISMNENGETSQKLLSQLGSKKIKHIYMDKYNKQSQCYLAACNEYDKHLHFYKAYDQDYNVSIERGIQPNIIKVHDIFVTQQGQMRILSMKDDDFIIDQVLNKSKDQDQPLHNSYIYSSVRAFNANWPYVTFSGLENYLLLINVYNTQVMHRIQFAPLKEYVLVCQTFISNTKDLFLVIKRGMIFEVLMLDLDELNDKGDEDETFFKFTKILEYSDEEVGGGSLTSMFVRGSSRKEMIQLNQKLMIFLQHEKNLYCWNEGQPVSTKKLSHLNLDRLIISTSILVQDDNTFYYLQISTDEKDSISEVCRVNIAYSTHEVTILFSENSLQFDFFGFKIDRNQGIMMLLIKQIQQSNDDNVLVKIINLYDNDDILVECEIFDEQLKGIFNSGEFSLIDGHIYFNNNAIKLRYDLMRKYGGSGYNQELYFNQYMDILDLNEGDVIKTSCPIDSPGSHRLTYVVMNNKGGPKRLILVPYLHERKIYLNRQKKNTDYFYTSKQMVDKYSNKLVSLIFAFNLTESKFYVYSEQGLLLKRIEFSDHIKNYGEIVCTSPNGLNFALHNKRTDTITIIRFNEEQVCILKSLHVECSLEQFLLNTQDTELFQDQWIFQKNPKQMQYELKINDKADLLIQINRKDDYSRLKSEEIETVYFFNANFKIDKNCQHEQQIDPQFKKECKRDLKRFQEEQNHGQNLIIIQGVKKFQINEDTLFVWDNHAIQFYHFSQTFNDKNKKQLNFKISLNEKFSFIKNVLTGSQSDQIAIVVEQLQCSNVIQWDLINDVEIKAFEVDKNHEIIWDQKGKFLILTQDQTTLPFQNCNLKCYNINNLEECKVISSLPYSQGHRFDNENHNWIIMKQYICFSFSYMTFVIQSQIEDIELKEISEEPLLNEAFDLEAFNYLLDKDSCFTNGKLAKESFLKFQQILLKMKQIDPVSLEILHYTREEKLSEAENEQNLFDVIGRVKKSNIITRSALYEAFQDGNNRVIDEIMLYMSQISIDNSEQFKQILPELIEIQSFRTYLENLPHQTQQMVDKKVLRVKEPLNDTIVTLQTSITSYIDEDFYKEKVGEDMDDKDCKGFPVDVVSLKVGWIISTQEGKQFLQAILQSERLEYYEIRSLQVIIEFLYLKTKALLLNYLLPLYLLQGLTFFTVIILQEIRVFESKGNDIGMDSNKFQDFTTSIIVLNQIQMLIMVIIMARVFYLTGSSFFKRVYTWFDIVFYSLNTIANMLALSGDGISSMETQRLLQSFSILFFLAKNFYFMKLVDEIAPLVDIIIQVFFDIKWFLFVFMAFVLCFGISFFLIGNNQQDFDSLTDEDMQQLPYQTIPSSILYMWNVCLGGGGSDSFTLGDATQEKYLNVLFIAAQFIMLIHLLNMLIAIMGNTFGNRNEVAEQIKIRDHLAFVIDNWYLKDYSLGDTKQINYIIAAFHHQGGGEDAQLLEQLQESFQSLQEKIEADHKDIVKRQRVVEQYHRMNEQNQRMRDFQTKEQEEKVTKQGKMLQDQVTKQGKMLQEILTIIKQPEAKGMEMILQDQ